MKKLKVGQHVLVKKTIAGQFFTGGTGILVKIKGNIGTVNLTTAKGLWGQTHRSSLNPVKVEARTINIKATSTRNKVKGAIV
ncbi:MAG: hypothetical protein COB41_01885 [Proteobacteria bacterium]|nr:MAG: hypothetical protein COB41_01885 [Pseudomonadota bacterium]